MNSGCSSTAETLSSGWSKAGDAIVESALDCCGAGRLEGSERVLNDGNAGGFRWVLYLCLERGGKSASMTSESSSPRVLVSLSVGCISPSSGPCLSLCLGSISMMALCPRLLQSERQDEGLSVMFVCRETCVDRQEMTNVCLCRTTKELMMLKYKHMFRIASTVCQRSAKRA